MQLYSNTDTAIAKKKYHFILSERSACHCISELKVIIFVTILYMLSNVLKLEPRPEYNILPCFTYDFIVVLFIFKTIFVSLEMIISNNPVNHSFCPWETKYDFPL